MAAPPHAFRVDAQSIAYAGFRREGGVYTVAETAEAALPPETFHEGLLGGPPREPERFREAVAALVGGLSDPPREASLVLPDAWLRVAFTDLAAPPTGADREEVLRWKLKRLVPFRVDELRLTAQTVLPLPRQSEEEPPSSHGRARSPRRGRGVPPRGRGRASAAGGASRRFPVGESPRAPRRRGRPRSR